MNSASEIINASLTMKDVLDKYHHIGKKGRCDCPIHKGENNNFCYTDKVFHCWTCGAKGNVISFVMQLFNISYNQALLRLDLDFGLNLPLSRAVDKTKKREIDERVLAMRKAREEERALAEAREQEYDELLSEYVKCEIIIQELKPRSPDDEIFDIYVDAVNKIDILAYKLDCFERR